jgi:sortase A
VFLSAEAHIYQHLESRHFDSPVRTVSPEKASACESISVDQGTAIGRLEISRVGISVVVLEGDDAHTLRLGAGRVPGTAWPGHGGNVAIAAHRDTFFRGLRDVRKDDRIRLLTTANEYVYRVESTLIVNPTQVEVLDPTSQPTLTLITCYPFHYIGDAPDRFIVRALQISSLRRSSTECPGTRSR